MKKNSIDLVPVILAGGVGERLWPISRHSRPKQFAEIFDKTLFEKTLDRVKALNSIYKPIVITNFEYRFIVKELSKKNKTKIDSIILEPTPKNTAPAFLLASLNVLKVHGNKNILFLPSDHIMKDDNAFVKLINRSINFLNDENIITFGIQPREKNSEYGYIEIDQKQKNSTKPNNVKKFIEKPKNKLLDKIHANKNFFWNSGIYFCKASVIDQLTQKFDPILYDLTSKAYKNKKNEFDCDLVSEKYFRKIKPISIDYAVMEHAKNLLLVKFNSIWSDLGSWNSINQYVKKDNNLNFKKGNVI
ncbi:mannose-1-phosphate guanylyltransferase, partial [Methylophilaceae bacterium]|nr:mannose-1-phosphate guanylyltransferase [Methylophilaceae bacterium]